MDADRFAQHWTTWRPELEQYAARMLPVGCKDEAPDVVSNAYLLLRRHVATLDESRLPGVRAFCAQRVAWLCQEYRRGWRRERQQRTLSLDTLLALDGRHSAQDVTRLRRQLSRIGAGVHHNPERLMDALLTPDGEQPETQIEQQEAILPILAALRQVAQDSPVRGRLLPLLVSGLYEHYGPTILAERLGVSRRHVQNEVCRLRAQLRALLPQYQLRPRNGGNRTSHGHHHGRHLPAAS